MTSPITLIYKTTGAASTFNIVNFFTRTTINGCDIVCNYGDSCGGAFTGTNVSVTDAADPWEITALENVIPGYSQVVCLQCTSNNAATSPFEIVFTIV